MNIRIMGFALFAVLAGLAAPFLAAQDSESAVIYHVEGLDFSLAMNGERRIIPADVVRRGGINLEASGMISTGPGTFVEIQLIPSGSVIKLSENTTFIYNGYDRDGGGISLGLLYGRIRLVTAPAGMNPFVVHGGGVSVRIDEGDFGVDYFLDPDNLNFALRPVFRIYALRGDAAVFPSGLRPEDRGDITAFFGSLSNLRLDEGWGLSVDISSSFTFAERAPLGSEIISYWRAHNFAGPSPRYRPSTIIRDFEPSHETASQIYFPAEPSDGSPQTVQQFQGSGAPAEERQLVVVGNRSKHTALALGLILTTASVIVQGVAYSQFGTANDHNAHNVFRGAYATLGLGLVLTLAGALYNPTLEYR